METGLNAMIGVLFGALGFLSAGTRLLLRERCRMLGRGIASGVLSRRARDRLARRAIYGVLCGAAIAGTTGCFEAVIVGIALGPLAVRLAVRRAVMVRLSRARSELPSLFSTLAVQLRSGRSLGDAIAAAARAPGSLSRELSRAREREVRGQPLESALGALLSSAILGTGGTWLRLVVTAHRQGLAVARLVEEVQRQLERERDLDGKIRDVKRAATGQIALALIAPWGVLAAQVALRPELADALLSSPITPGALFAALCWQALGVMVGRDLCRFE